MLLDVYSLLSDDATVFPQLSEKLSEEIETRMQERFSQTTMAKSLEISKATFRWNMKQKSFPFPRFVKLLNELQIDTAYAFNQVHTLHVWGSRNPPIHIERWLPIDSEAAQLIGLYHAEGDRNTSKLVITNSEPTVMLYLQQTLTRMFPDIRVHVLAIDPPGEATRQSTGFHVSRRRTGMYNTITKYRVIVYSAVVARIINRISRERMEDLLADKNLACAWARGILAGEGTVRNSRERYVRVEMKDRLAITMLSRVFNLVDIPHKVSERKDRPGMWVAYVGAKDLRALSEKIGFGCHVRRQKKLDMAATRR